MKHKFYKNVTTAIAICFLASAVAQKVDKKFTENFKVNKDVSIAIHAYNTEINVTTWSKNEVQVNAYIEVEGISKKEAEKYIDSWNFEALGNKNKVKIVSKGSNNSNFKGDFVFFGDKNFSFPDIKMPDLDIDIPDLDFDFDFNFEEMFDSFDALEENIIKNNKYSFEFNDGEEHIVIKSKEDWEKFKKSKKYEELKKNLKKEMENIKIKFSASEEKINKEKIKKEIEKAKLEFKKIDKEKIKKELEKAKEQIMKIRFDHTSTSENIIIDGKKVKILKRIEIKVPKDATFNLNTRHCKVKLPNTVASGNVNYGSFNANNLLGGKLTINYSPVNINSLNACNLFLNNVTDAKIASVTNTTMRNNSSGVHIFNINEDVILSDEFGELTIDRFNPNFNEFVLNLSNSNATLILGEVKTNFNLNINKSRVDNKYAFDFLNKVIKNYDVSTKSTITNPKTNNKLTIKADYSTIVIK